MESAIPALIILTLLILLSMTLAEQILVSHEVAGESWLAMEERQLDRSQTGISITDAWAPLNTQVQVLVRNDGRTKLADFDQWDVILRADSSAEWYDPSDCTLEIDEGLEYDILNPGETMTLTVPVSPGTIASDNLIVLTTPNGVSASRVFTD